MLLKMWELQVWPWGDRARHWNIQWFLRNRFYSGARGGFMSAEPAIIPCEKLANNVPKIYIQKVIDRLLREWL
jgi:hypothetical protein